MAPDELDVKCGCTPVIDTEYGDEYGESPSEVIVEAIAAAEGVDPMELQPVYESVDLDALDDFFCRRGGAIDSEAVLSFTIDPWNVFVRGDGRIRICDATQPTEAEPVFEKSTP